MSRSPRIEYEGAWYHVSNQGISMLPVFETQEHRKLLFELLDDVYRMFNSEIHAYSLTHDGYHLLIHTPSANLSRVMRYINGIYTQRYNRLEGRKGPLFCGRYKSVLIHADMYLSQVSRYIHWLPVLSGFCKHPGDYTWSSYPAYCNKTKMPRWLFCQHILNRFELNHISLSYASYMKSGVDKEILSFYHHKHVGPVLGPKTFRKQIQSYSSVSHTSLKTQNMNNKPSVCDVIDYVKTNYLEGHYQNIGIEFITLKKIAMLLCREIAGHNLKEIADAFEVGNPRSVSVIVRRVKTKVNSDIALMSFYKIIREKFVLEYC